MRDVVKKMRGVFLVLIALPLSVLAHPVVIPFHENETHHVRLSNTNINRLQVAGDHITAVICPQGYCSATEVPGDSGGGKTVQLVPSQMKAFTLYVVTLAGRHVSLDVQPQKRLGRTVLLQPEDGSAQTTATERSSPYSRYVIALMRAMLQGKAPAGFGTQVIKHRRQWMNHQVSITLVKRYQGDHLLGQVFALCNHGKRPITLSPSEFYHHSVRAAALSQQTLAPGARGLLYTLGGRGDGG